MGPSTAAQDQISHLDVLRLWCCWTSDSSSTSDTLIPLDTQLHTLRPESVKRTSDAEELPLRAPSSAFTAAPPQRCCCSYLNIVYMPCTCAAAATATARTAATPHQPCTQTHKQRHDASTHSCFMPCAHCSDSTPRLPNASDNAIPCVPCYNMQRTRPPARGM